jgi:PAS domain-containing protein
MAAADPRCGRSAGETSCQREPRFIISPLQNLEQNQNTSFQPRHLDYLRSGDGEHATTLWADQVGFWRMDVEADRIYWSNDWCERLDLDPCVGPDHTPRWNERIHPLDQGDTDSYERLIEGASTLYEAEYRLRTLSGGC